MDAFKAQFERIRQQLAALTATQKMLVTALVAVMVLTMLYWGRYASNAEMVSVLGDQTLTEEDIGPIVQQLESQNIPYKVDSGKVLVPTEHKSEILASLMFNRALPSNTQNAFESVSKTLNPFTGNTEREAAYNQATAMELSDLIGRFPGVSYAHVVINAKYVREIGGDIPPSATVIVNTRGEAEHLKQLVRACADGVAHAVSNLTPGQISVIVNGQSLKVPDGDSMAGGDLADIRKAREAELEQKIRNQFSFIDGMTVSVNCDVENSETKTTTDEYDKAKSLSQPKSNTESSQETTNSTPAAREPGASPNTGGAGTNTGISLDGQGGAPAPNNTSNTTKTETTYDNFQGHTGKEIHTPAGKDTVVSATVRVPLSYFTSSYKHANPKASDPSDDVLATYRTTELTKIRDGVRHVTGLKSDADLSVDTYADVATELALAAAPAAPTASLSTVTGHAREIGVAVLAVISLLMMATMVRKSTPAPLVIPSSLGSGASTAARSEEVHSLGSGESLAGEVGAGNGALDGMEMDEDAVRTQQMLDQVSTMVKENPDGAAALVKRWLSRA